MSDQQLRVIGYCRVSTDKQGSGHGLGGQHAALEHFCSSTAIAADGDERCHQRGCGRPMYGREVAISAIESGVTDALLVRALDRATRDQEDAAKLFKRAERNDWRLMDCDKADSGDPSHRLLADIRSASALKRACSGRGSGGSGSAGRPDGPATAKRIVGMHMREGLSAKRSLRS